MIDMQKVGTNWGYAPARASYGTAFGATGPTGSTGPSSPTQPPAATTQGGTVTVNAQQPAPAPTYQPASMSNPFAGEMWTPEQWGQVSDYAYAGMQNPYQQSEGVTKAMSGVDEMMASGGYGGSLADYRSASDPAFALQQKKISDMVRQAALTGGFDDSTMMTDRLTQRLSENALNRESDLARMGVGLEEARRARMMQGLGMYGQLGGQQAGEYGEWANRGMNYANMLGGMGDRYFRAPFDFATGTGQQAEGWAGTQLSPYEQMYNDYFNVDSETQKYTPGILPQLGGFLGGLGEMFGEDIGKGIK